MGSVTASTIGKAIGTSWERSDIPSDLHGCDWYVVWVMPKTARRTVAHLRRLGIEAYVPLRSQTVLPRARRGKSRKAEVRLLPAYPGYVFVGLRRQSLFGVVVSVDGVIDFLRHEGAPISLRVSVMADVIERERDGTLDDPTFKVVVGDIVLITEGLFSGQRARVRRVSKRDAAKMATETVPIGVEFSLFGRAHRVAVPSNHLSRLDKRENIA